jgi:hypothetical protein
MHHVPVAHMDLASMLSDSEAMSCDDVASPVSQSAFFPMCTDPDDSHVHNYNTDMSVSASSLNDNNVFKTTLTNLVCSNCKRQDSDECKLDLIVYCGKFTKRRYCNITVADGREPLTLCLDCRIFLNITSSTSKDLCSHGWPSVLTYLLINSDIRCGLWRYLSYVHRISLSALANDLDLSLDIESIFCDNTQAVSSFNDRVKPGLIADFLLNITTTSWPSVKCAAGCMEFIEKCIAIPFNHFLAWKFGISIYEGTSIYFNGARSDWPSCSIELSKFKVNPGLIINERELGSWVPML